VALPVVLDRERLGGAEFGLEIAPERRLVDESVEVAVAGPPADARPTVV
jgi:hypothetical protein